MILSFEIFYPNVLMHCLYFVSELPLYVPPPPRENLEVKKNLKKFWRTANQKNVNKATWGELKLKVV